MSFFRKVLIGLGIISLASGTPDVAEGRNKPNAAQTQIDFLDYSKILSKIKAAFSRAMNADKKNFKQEVKSFAVELYSGINKLNKDARKLKITIDKNKKIKQQALGRLEDLQHETFEMIEGIARKAGDKGYQYGGDGEDFYTLSIDVGRQ